MKQLFVGIILLACLVGCDEKPKFSINVSDTLETYANNPAFTAIKVSSSIDAKTDGVKKVAYQFTNVPVSVYGIDTADIDVLGGIILFSERERVNTSLTIKGKESFSKLDERISKLKDFSCKKLTTGNLILTQCGSVQLKSNAFLNLQYNPFSDIVSFSYMKY